METKLSKTSIEGYVQTNGNTCPYCGSRDLSCGEFQTDDFLVYRGVVCGGCQKEWTDEYTLTGVTEDEDWGE